MGILKFHYSFPFEETWAEARGIKIDQDHHQRAEVLTRFVQELWDPLEEKVLSLFEEIYKIKIKDEEIIAYFSLLAPHSFSDPLTLSLNRFSEEIEKDEIIQRGFICNVVHELAHFFAYKYPGGYFDELFQKIMKRDLLGNRGANLHYLIQALEFGIASEVLDEGAGIGRRDYIISLEQYKNYSRSAKRLKEDEVPLDKSCLEYINREILS